MGELWGVYCEDLWENLLLYNDTTLYNFWARILPQGDHYCDIVMSAIVSQISGVFIVYSTICSDADQRKHQSSASLAFVWGIHRWPVNSPHKRPVTQKMFPFDDVIMFWHGSWRHLLKLEDSHGLPQVTYFLGTNHQAHQWLYLPWHGKHFRITRHGTLLCVTDVPFAKSLLYF